MTLAEQCQTLLGNLNAKLIPWIALESFQLTEIAATDPIPVLSFGHSFLIHFFSAQASKNWLNRSCLQTETSTDTMT